MKEQQQTKFSFKKEYVYSDPLKDARDDIAEEPGLTMTTCAIVGAETALAGASTTMCIATNAALAGTVALGGLATGVAAGYLIYSACKSARESEEYRRNLEIRNSSIEAKDREIAQMRQDIQNRDQDIEKMMRVIENREEERIIQRSAIISLVRENSTMEEERKWHLQTIQRYREENLRQLRESRNKDKALEALQDVTGICFVNAEPLSVVEGVPLEEETKEETQQEETKDNETWQSREESRSPRGSARECL